MNRIVKFAGVGVMVTLFDFAVYTLCMALLFKDDINMTAVAAIISGLAAMILAYIMHRNITWKERSPGQYGIVKFFVWNIFMAIALRPVATTLFAGLTGLYQFAFMISDFLHLPFSYDFVTSTGVYCLMTSVVMILNFLVYEKLVFEKVDKEKREKVDVKNIGQTGKEQDSQRKGK